MLIPNGDSSLYFLQSEEINQYDLLRTDLAVDESPQRWMPPRQVLGCCRCRKGSGDSEDKHTCCSFSMGLSETVYKIAQPSSGLIAVAVVRRLSTRELEMRSGAEFPYWLATLISPLRHDRRYCLTSFCSTSIFVIVIYIYMYIYRLVLCVSSSAC